MILVSAGVDRPDLARELVRQRLFFYRALAVAEFRLALNAVGFDSVRVPSLELVRPLALLHVEFCRLAPELSAARA
jgi:hypothetical protein